MPKEKIILVEQKMKKMEKNLADIKKFASHLEGDLLVLSPKTDMPEIRITVDIFFKKIKENVVKFEKAYQEMQEIYFSLPVDQVLDGSKYDQATPGKILDEAKKRSEKTDDKKKSAEKK